MKHTNQKSTRRIVVKQGIIRSQLKKLISHAQQLKQ